MDDRSTKRLKGPGDGPLEDRRPSPYGAHPMQQRYSSAPYGSHAPPGYAWPAHYNGQGPPGPPGTGHPPSGPPGLPGGGPPPPHWAQVGGYGPPSRSPPPLDAGNWPPNGNAPYPSRNRKPPSSHREDEMEGPPGRYWSGGPPGSSPPPHHPPVSSPPSHLPPGPYHRESPGYWQQPGRMYPGAPSGWSKSSPRGPPRQEMIGAYPPGRGEEMGYISTMSIQQPSQASFYDDDGAESSAGESGKDKGGVVTNVDGAESPKRDTFVPTKPKSSVVPTSRLQRHEMPRFK